MIRWIKQSKRMFPVMMIVTLLILSGCAASGGSASIQGRNDAGPHLYGRIGVGYSI